MRGVDFLGLAFVSAESKHRQGNLVLPFGRQPLDELKRFFQKLSHDAKDRPPQARRKGAPTLGR